MTITKERVEKLRDILLIKLRSAFEEIYHDVQAELEEDPIKFLFDYIKYLKKDTRASIGNSSSNSYIYIDFPLSRRDFTEEELKYLEFYE